MEIGIIGLPQSGKSTLFKIMTGVNSAEQYGEPYVKGIAKVPDARFEKLVEIFKPKKVSPATVPFIDVNASGEKAWDETRKALSGVDGILHIVNAFANTETPEIIKNYKKLFDELIISDLMVVENRLERLNKTAGKGAAKPDDVAHLKVLPRLKEALEKGTPVRDLKLSPDEVTSLKGFSFWTIRPELTVLNIAEGLADPSASIPNSIGICCQIESDIASLPLDEQKLFMSEMGITVPAFEKVIKRSFELLGRISYFTVGEDEVKAWVVPANSTAPKAASAIHKDFEKGFIKAEVISYDDFMALGGTIAAAKSAGKFRLEGKEYIVKDGDIINFRVNT